MQWYPVLIVILSPVGIGAFANFIPEIGEIVGSRPKYGGVYKVEQKRTS